MEICIFQRWPKTGLLASFQTIRAHDVILVSAGQPTPLHSVGEAGRMLISICFQVGVRSFSRTRGEGAGNLIEFLAELAEFCLEGRASGGGGGGQGREMIQLVGRLSFLQAFELQG